MIDYISEEQMPAVIHLEPVWQDGTVPIVTAANNYTIAYTSVLLQALLQHCQDGRNYDVIIAHINVSAQNRAVIQEMAEGRGNFSLRFAQVDPVHNNRYFRFERRFVEVDLLKIFAPLLLRRYQNMLFWKEECIPLFDPLEVARLYSGNACLSVLPQAPGLQLFRLERCRRELSLGDFVRQVRIKQNRTVAAVQEEVFHQRMALIEGGDALKAIQYWERRPWEDPDCLHGEAFWMLARETPYYEALRLRLLQTQKRKSHGGK